MQTAITIEPVLSVFGKPVKVYANKGEVVKVVSVFNDVVIVEKKDGNRFPVSVRALQEIS